MTRATWCQPRNSPTQEQINSATAFIDDFTTCIPMTLATRCQPRNSQTQEQINSATAFIDASQVYGNNKGEVGRVRDINSPDGLLRISYLSGNVKPLLPQLQRGDPKVFCRSYSNETPCFYTGDYRRNNVSPG